MPPRNKPAVAPVPVVVDDPPVLPAVVDEAVEPPAVTGGDVVEFMPPLVDEDSVAGETPEPEAPVEDAPVEDVPLVIVPPTLADVVAAAERVGNEYHVRPALRVDAAVERELEKLGYAHERSGAHVTVLYRK